MPPREVVVYTCSMDAEDVVYASCRCSCLYLQRRLCSTAEVVYACRGYCISLQRILCMPAEVVDVYRGCMYLQRM